MIEITKGSVVYAFKGRAYHGRAGIEYRPLEVSIDFGPWRPTENEDGKVVRDFLFDRGYMSAHRVMGKGDACDYSEWFCRGEMITSDLDTQPRELKIVVDIIKAVAVERKCTTLEAMEEGLHRKQLEMDALANAWGKSTSKSV